METTTFSEQALARFVARHAAADDLQFNMAGFWYDRKSETFLVEVRGYIVARFKTLVGVREFCALHNDRLSPRTLPTMKTYIFSDRTSAMNHFEIVAASPAEARRALVAKHGAQPYRIVNITR